MDYIDRVLTAVGWYSPIQETIDETLTNQIKEYFFANKDLFMQVGSATVILYLIYSAYQKYKDNPEGKSLKERVADAFDEYSGNKARREKIEAEIEAKRAEVANRMAKKMLKNFRAKKAEEAAKKAEEAAKNAVKVALAGKMVTDFKNKKAQEAAAKAEAARIEAENADREAQRQKKIAERGG